MRGGTSGSPPAGWRGSGWSSSGAAGPKRCPAPGAGGTAAWPTLRRFLATAGPCAVGLDFPFGLPAPLLEADDWRETLLGLADRYEAPEAFQADCRRRSEGREWRRVTDREARSPFSPYNLRMYRQTFYGLCEVLAPLVAEDAVCVLPMQAGAPGKPWLLEICPASTLRRLDLYQEAYKGPSPKTWCKIW